MELLGPIVRSAELAHVIEGLTSGDRAERPPRVRVGGLWGSSCAYFAAGLSKRLSGGILVVTSSVETADEFASDFGLFSDTGPTLFPAWDILPEDERLINLEVFGERLGVLRTLLFKREEADEGVPEIVVTSVQALLQPVVPPEALLSASLEFRPGADLRPEELSELLVEQGFERYDVAEVPGQFAMRGGIVDLVPLGARRGLRIEFFDDRIESVREFDPGTQRSTGRLDSARALAIAGDASQHLAGPERPSFLVYVPRDWLVVWVEAIEVQERAERALAAEEGTRHLLSYEKVMRACSERPMLETSVLQAAPGPGAVNFETSTTERFSGEVRLVSEELGAYVEANDRVFVFCNNLGEEQRLRELLAGTALQDAPDVGFRIGHLFHGFQFATGRTAFLAHHEIFHRYGRHRQIKRRVRSQPVDSFLELAKNDYVVHITHGIARYRGLAQFEKAGEMQEFLDLEFADGVRLYVPATKIDLVQKYIGAVGAPALSKLGGDAWQKRKSAAREAVRSLALDLIELQAARAKLPGFPFPGDDSMMREFEDAFIYPETEDQLYVMGELRRDMELSRPMDRLLCGDVGYGKTELAMRAAFKAVEAGRQAAVLVPTTVLAQQHYRTFSERMADYPVVVDVLSRFKTRGEQRRTLDALAEGKIDILIGTHRLLSADVTFRDLGLVIVDEEQRFGVEHKERLKRMRYSVDVLTMTATPIPRTLHMSLLGIRDISSLETPPQDRLSIHTEVCRFDEKRIRDAILRELNRDGQVFFVHNRVYNIGAVAHRIAKIVPDARLVIGHGQMKESQLEERMATFVDGGADVLVSTTIVESGLDIPNANTIFINEADTFGLADLHQLRGRVGRYKHRAYAYLLLPEGRPVTKTAVKRLKAVEEYSELGAGFKLAMRDLELRGAGNILGAEQSGHIVAVGYDLYCRLLEQAVRELKNEEVERHTEIDIDLHLDAYLPSDYIASDVLKMEGYRRLARARTVEEVREAEAELEDRYGLLPLPAVNLVAKHRLRVRLEPRRFTYFGLRGDHILLKFEDRALATESFRSVAEFLRILTEKSAHLLLPPNVRGPQRVVEHTEQLLE